MQTAIQKKTEKGEQLLEQIQTKTDEQKKRKPELTNLEG